MSDCNTIIVSYIHEAAPAMVFTEPVVVALSTAYLDQLLPGQKIKAEIGEGSIVQYIGVRGNITITKMIYNGLDNANTNLTTHYN